ncbi:hypothetical protein Agabi119p4_5486 [Agaricus bisporus var. burnettii]|uniref:Uncharacterized protein n=1 Tax=Agaricus bisporus var. burnettii TaxID=192524 RepID=A0A8H7F1U8_AGABI|nr:hypothetical protein Agabi119p4_5486 [Agaricus bisporus var. burnettii]
MDSVFGFIARELESFVVSATGAHNDDDDDQQEQHTDERPEQHKRRRGREPETLHASKRRRRRSKSVTMPGSLYPRSPSLEPATPQQRAVRFSPVPGPSKTPSPVKTAIQRFRVDADPSMLLPHSPASRTPESTLSSKARGKRRAFDDDFDLFEPEHSGELRVRGKERELKQALQRQMENEARPDLDQNSAEEERDKDKERIRQLEQEIRLLRDELAKRPSLNDSTSFPQPPAPPPPPPPPPLPNQSILRLPADADDASILFTAARASLKHQPTPKEKPINPPHVSRRKGQPTIGVTPDKMAAFLHEMKSVRLRKTGRELDSSSSFSSGSGLSFNSTRTDESTSIGEDVSILPRSLTGLIPFRPTHSTSRTVNKPKRRDTLDILDVRSRHNLSHDRALLPAAQLANEMHPPNQPSSSTSSASPVGLFSGSSCSSTEPATSDQGASAPRLPSWHTQIKETDPPILTPSLSSDEPEKEDERDQPPSTPPQVIPSRSVYRFRGTGIPVTPLEHSRSSRSLISRKVPFPQTEPDYEQVEENATEDTQSAHYEDSFVPIHPTTPEDPSVAPIESTVFKRRLPVSPLPSKSPRKPPPPSRRRSTPHPKKLSLTDDDHAEPLPMLSFSTPPVAVSTPGFNTHASAKPFLDTPDIFGEPLTSRGRLPPSRIPIRSSRLRSSSRSRSRSISLSNKTRSDGHLTLGEELWIARHSDGTNNDDDDDILADEVYVGSGTRNKKQGFLAHGGAGGIPLFMEADFVERPEEERERGNVLYSQKSTADS